MSKNFADLGIGKDLIDRLENMGIKEATNVQEKVIPLILERKNILFQSETGTGKTFAYLLPLLENLKNDCASSEEKKSRVKILILSPTYELASQIKSQIQNISELKCALLIGGSPLNRQIELLKEKPEIVIGSPQRILELIHLKKLKIDQCQALVLDETDRLLAKELRDSSQELLEYLSYKIQLIGNSATVNEYTKNTLQKIRLEAKERECEKIRGNLEEEKDFIEKNPLELVLLPPEDVLRKRINHQALYAERRDKIDTLRSYIRAVEPEKMIVFTSKADQIQNIVSKLKYKKIDCQGLSAKCDKKERKAVIDRFKSGKIKILVTSDLLARGLDINDISHVVQLDLNENEDFFIHRAGRTARAGKCGINMVIGDERELEKYERLEKKLGLTVYPKVLYKGKLSSPEVLDGNIKE